MAINSRYQISGIKHPVLLLGDTTAVTPSAPPSAPVQTPRERAAMYVCVIPGTCIRFRGVTSTTRPLYVIADLTMLYIGEQ